MKVNYLILGAGPAGLTLAHQLERKGEHSFLVLEKENTAGGLCRSADVDGSPFDIGGGHFLDVKRPEVNCFLFEFLPEEEWNLFHRDSRIHVNGQEIGHPIEANIWQMDLDDQVRYLKSIAAAGCNRGEEKPDRFVEWITWKLGDRIAEDYMLPYNRKMFSEELNTLGTYWLEKLPNVSFEETLRSCLEKKAYGTQPGHARFYYPKQYGYGEVWRRMAECLGDRLICSSPARGINFDTCEVITDDGVLSADCIFVTVPWTGFDTLTGLPEALRAQIGNLKHSAVETRYYERQPDTPAQWIYYPDPALAYHRILVRSNFCPGSRGCWTETNARRVPMLDRQDGGGQGRFRYLNEYAYPLNTIDKPAIMNALLTWAETRRVIGVGRWGEWQHFNSDVTVERAMAVVARLGEA